MQRGNIVPIPLHILRPALTILLVMVSNTRVGAQYTSKRPISSSVTVSVYQIFFVQRSDGLATDARFL